MADQIEPQADLAQPRAGFLIVGLGASAGGIEALREFFGQVPADSGIAYVVILHLSPEHESQLASVLQTVTPLSVAQVTETVRVEPNRVYVVSPNQHLTMVDGSLTVSPNTLLEERRAPVDIFFRTLAETHDSRAVCVILSGSGTDGSMGLKRVKERGGAVFVQSPREAGFNEMPRNAIATDLVDDVLPVAAIPARIIAYQASLGTIAIPVEADMRPEAQQQALREVFTQLRVRTGHDFSDYKRPTLLRRIERRINVRGLANLPAYAAYLRDTPDEVQALLKDLLISVTNFFRDKDAFKVLEQEVIPQIFQGKRAEDQVRIWVVGCATGEEAYSIAMLCAERVLGAIDAPSVQIFATDIDEAAIAHARQGLYTANDTADVAPERLRRFFTREDQRYRIRREIREMILFANHNVLKDPPFSHIDLATCRNLLIYLNHTAQERVLETLHFALKPAAFLFLGTSESVDGSNDLFATINREQHVFQSRAASMRPFPVPDAVPIGRVNPAHLVPESQPGEQAHDRISYGDLHLRLLEQYAPPSVVLDEEYNVVHLSGRAGRYLEIADGALSRNLLDLIRPELRVALRAALYQAMQRLTNVQANNLPFRLGSRTETVTIHVRPVLPHDDPARGFLLIVFEPGAPTAGDAQLVVRPEDPITRQLEEEVERLRSQLHTSSEQHEYQAEELKVSNEELQALNEELRSAAEELETSKEELQSINEELRTVNQELKVKIEEATLHSTNLQNLVNSAEVGTIFLDRTLSVKLFTPAARELFNLIPTDYGRPLSNITHRLADENVLADVETVLAQLQTIEREVRTTNNRVFVLRVLPYRAGEDRIGGVVITFFDITERKRAEEALRASQDRLQLALGAAEMGTFLYHIVEDRGEPDTRMLELFGQPEGGTLNLAEALKNLIHPDDRSRYANAVALATDPAGDGVLRSDIRVLQPDGSARWVAVTAQVLFDGQPRRATVMYGVAADITERKRNEQRQAFLLLLNDALRPLIDPIEIQDVAARMLGEHLNADRTYYALVEGDYEAAVIERDYVRGDTPSVVGKHAFADFGSIFAAYTTGQVLVLDDVEDGQSVPAADLPAYRALSVRSLVSTPLFKNGKTVASISVLKAAPHHWTAQEISLVEEIGERTWAAVERARAQAALRESEVRFRMLADAVPQLIWTNDANGHANYFNQRWYDYSGLTYDQSAGPGWQAIVHPDDAAKANERWQQALAHGEIFDTEYRLRRADGAYRWHLGRNAPMHGDPGTIATWFGTATDIEELKQAEAARHESDERFRLLVEGAPDFAMFLLDANEQVIFWSSGAEHVFGWSADEMTGQSGDIIFTPEDRDRGEPERETAHALATGHSEDRRWHIRKDGRRIFIDGVLIRLDDEQGQMRGFAKIGRDATVQRQAEEALRQAHADLERRVEERTAELAQLSATRQELLQRVVTVQEDERSSLARNLHDSLGQYLTALTIHLGRLQTIQGVPPEIPAGLEHVQAVAAQIDAEVDRLTTELRPLLLDDFGLDDALARYAEEWSATSGIPIDVVVTEPRTPRLPGEVETTAYRIVQEALTNVHKHAQARHASIIVEHRAKLLRVIVEDDGIGFDTEATRRGRSGGRQLGLVGMAERAGLVDGTLTIESQPDRGTTIYLDIPLAGD